MSTGKTHKIVIIEDEVRIQQGLQHLLNDINGVEVIGVAGCLKKAKLLIDKERPDILLLDVNLEDGNGFELIETLDHREFALIFITAYDNHAIQAIKYQALDYLLKPIDPEELEDAIEKARVSIAYQDKIEKKPPVEQFVIRTIEGRFIIPFKSLIRCEACEGYTRFFLINKVKYMVAKPLKYFEDLLPTQQFLRVHQSHLINADYVKGMSGNLLILSPDHNEVPVSTRKKAAVKQFISSYKSK